MEFVFWIHFAATWAMIGACVFVLVVHYPGFQFFSKEQFGAYEQFHVRRTMRLAVPVLCVEAVTAVLLVALRFQWLFLVNVVLLAAIWLLTFRNCVPSHKKMRDQFCAFTYEHLKKYHLARVLLWLIRGVLLFFVTKPH